jgi:BASS family bile acid:Na+ symporter
MLGTFGSGAAAVAVAFVLGSLVTGYSLGGPTRATRSVLGLGTGQRNIAAALLIATQNFSTEPGVVVMLLVSTFAGLAVLLLAARRFARQDTVVPPFESIKIETERVIGSDVGSGISQSANSSEE